MRKKSEPINGIPKEKETELEFTELISSNLEKSANPHEILSKSSTAKDYSLLLIGLTSCFPLAYFPTKLLQILSKLTASLLTDPQETSKLFKNQWKSTVISFFLVGLSLILILISVLSFTKFGEAQKRYWKSAYFSAAIRQQPRWVEKQGFKALSAKIDNDCNIIESAMGLKLFLLIISLQVFILNFSVGFAISWPIALIGLAMVSIQILGAYVMHKTVLALKAKDQENYLKACDLAIESLKITQIVAILNAEDSVSSDFIKELDALCGSMTVRKTFEGFCMAMRAAVEFCYSAIVIVVGGYLIENKAKVWGMSTHTDLESVIFVFFATTCSWPLLTTAFSSLSELLKASAITQTIVELTGKCKGSERLKQINCLQGRIEFEYVHLGKRFTQEPKGISFSLLPGERLVVLGGKNSGKSAIVDIIQGFSKPRAGVVRIDGVDIEDIDFEYLRKSIGLVQSNSFLFSGSIRENLSYGCCSPSSEDIEKVANFVGIKGFIEGLSKKYDTEAGNLIVNAEKLQKIALARALLKKPKILLLEGIADNLPADAENLINSLISGIISQSTIIITASSLNSLTGYNKLVHLKAENPMVSFSAPNKDPRTEISVNDHILLENPTFLTGIFHVFAILRNYWPSLIFIMITSTVASLGFTAVGYFFAQGLIYSYNAEEMYVDSISNMLLFTIGSVLLLLPMFGSLSRISALLLSDLRSNALKSMLCSKLALESNKDLSNILQRDCENVSEFVIAIMANTLIRCASIIGVIIIAGIYNIYLAIASGLAGVILAIGDIKAVEDNQMGQRSIGIAIEGFFNIKYVHTFLGYKYFEERYFKAGSEEKDHIKGLIWSGIIAGLQYCLLFSVYSCFILFGSYLVTNGIINTQDLVITFFCLAFSSSVSFLAHRPIKYKEFSTSLVNIYSLPKVTKKQTDSIDMIQKISYKLISNQLVLTSISFNLKATTLLLKEKLSFNGIFPELFKPFVEADEALKKELKPNLECRTTGFELQDSMSFSGSFFIKLKKINDDEAGGVEKVFELETLQRLGYYNILSVNFGELTIEQRRRILLAKTLCNQPAIVEIEKSENGLTQKAELRLV